MWEKKDKQCDPGDPDDAEQGSYWDHVIIDPESKLIVSLVVGRRNADAVVQIFTDFYDRTDGYLPELITTDGYAVYEPVILDTYGVWREELGLTPEEVAEFQSNGMPEFYFPVEITYAKVLKEKVGGRVVNVTSTVVLGSQEQAEETLAESEQSQKINTSFVERWFGTQRQFSGRKKRKAYTFSKDLSFGGDSAGLLRQFFKLRTGPKPRWEALRSHHRLFGSMSSDAPVSLLCLSHHTSDAPNSIRISRTCCFTQGCGSSAAVFSAGTATGPRRINARRQAIWTGRVAYFRAVISGPTASGLPNSANASAANFPISGLL